MNPGPMQQAGGGIARVVAWLRRRHAAPARRFRGGGHLAGDHERCRPAVCLAVRVQDPNLRPARWSEPAHDTASHQWP